MLYIENIEFKIRKNKECFLSPLLFRFKINALATGKKIQETNILTIEMKNALNIQRQYDCVYIQAQCNYREIISIFKII